MTNTSERNQCRGINHEKRGRKSPSLRLDIAPRCATLCIKRGYMRGPDMGAMAIPVEWRAKQI